MEGTVAAYRGSHKTQRPKHMIILPKGSSSKEDAVKFEGKKVIWTSPSGKKLEGVLTKPHGGKGAVRARFPEKGLPGQALGTKVEIL